ncbi:hypothetical protein CEXT_791641 [Caerostris extrusa]|uniref:Uncharacterized protein n=1 Tax=Caerostris extrusa TaxID=172846 RepID=A0AAV4QIE7_CAEEX|nr:hypothetical protein CEXT_791641 [Caerostris extrusa]
MTPETLNNYGKANSFPVNNTYELECPTNNAMDPALQRNIICNYPEFSASIKTYSSSSNLEHKISRSDLRADMLYAQYQPTTTSLQKVNLDSHCASSVKYEDIQSDISSDIPYMSQQYNFPQNITVGSFINVSKCYEHSSSNNHKHKISRSCLRTDMLYPQYQPQHYCNKLI